MPVLRWPRLPESDYDDLRGWLLDDVHLRMWLFSYTDPFGTTLTNMRYVKGLESFRRFSTGYAVGSIYIAKDWDA